jgi:hypothetical protein
LKYKVLGVDAESLGLPPLMIVVVVHSSLAKGSIAHSSDVPELLGEVDGGVFVVLARD